MTDLGWHCVIVCGGRSYSDYKRVCEMLDSVKFTLGDVPLMIVQGGASGADKLAKKWAFDRSVPCTTFSANWAIYGRKAGMIRNQSMLDETKPKLVVAFPGGRGTENMVRIARAANVAVIRSENFP